MTEYRDRLQMTPRQIEKQLQEARTKLTNQNQRLDKLAKEKAQAEREYRKMLAQTIENLRDNGVTATAVKDRAKGHQVVVDLMYERDLTKAQWRAALEATKNTRDEIQLLRSLLTQLRNEYENM